MRSDVSFLFWLYASKDFAETSLPFLLIDVVRAVTVVQENVRMAECIPTNKENGAKRVPEHVNVRRFAKCNL